MESASGSRHPDVVILDGAVWTGVSGAPGVEAVALTGNRVSATGSNNEVRDLIGPGTEVISAGGKTVMPGIVDAHNHVRLGSNPRAVSLFGATTLDEIRARIAAHVQANPDIDWIEGEGWSYQAVPAGGPTAAMIDDACSGKPAWLFSYDVHTVWLNSEGLRRWGAPEGVGSLPFGRLEIDAESGRPTGWVHDFAVMGIHPRGQRALEAIIPGYGKAAQYERLVQNVRDAIRFGITTIVEPQNGLADIDLFTRAQVEGELRSRLVAALIHTPEDSVDTLNDVVAAKHSYSGARLRLGPVKLYIDDVVEPCTAAMLAPYATPPHGVGDTFWSPADFADLIVRLEELDLQAFVHGTGDRGIRTALDGFAAGRAAHGVRDTRHQVVHVECLSGPDVGRFAELGVVACMQPRHCGPDVAHEWRDNVGPDRERYAWAMRSLADSGATLAFSSDWNVAEMDPMVGIYTALTRADLHGNDAWNLVEAVDLDTTLTAYTRGSAYANFLDDQLGTLEVGKLADVIVLSDNLHAIAPAEILETTVTHTIVDGDVVYRGGDR
jgi:predicted amidohydrolase YtcJ